MDWYPLWNSLRIAAISSVIVFFLGIFSLLCREAASRAQRRAGRHPHSAAGTAAHGRGLLPAAPLRRKPPLGQLLGTMGIRFVMTWYGGIVTASVVAFPLMYRTARGAFESFDSTLAYSGQTLGLSNTFIFWRIRMPYCRQGILAGAVLAFARALGEYGATSMLIGYTPGRTATISTSVYQYWRTGDDRSAMIWVLINLAISAVVLLSVNLLEKKQKGAARGEPLRRYKKGSGRLQALSKV